MGMTVHASGPTLSRGVREHAPRKILNLVPSEIALGAINLRGTVATVGQPAA